jgi:hypothetical protein
MLISGRVNLYRLQNLEVAEAEFNSNFMILTPVVMIRISRDSVMK